MKKFFLFLIVLAVKSGLISFAEEGLVVFPADSGIVNVKDYGAKGDGKTDDTKAIQEAFNQNAGNGSVIYLPPGEYIISDTIKWPGRQSFNCLQGAGQKFTVIRLLDNAPGFDNPEKPKNMFWTGGPPAQRFKNSVRDLSIDCGRNNPGAVGLSFCANNQGGVYDVEIRSGIDGKEKGAYGLALDVSEVGPLLIKRVTVIGFDIGIRVRHSVNSVTLEDIVLKGQRKSGIDNFNNYVFARNVRSENECVAVNNDGQEAVFVVIDSNFAGRGSVSSSLPAIRNLHELGTLYARNVKVADYAVAIYDSLLGNISNLDIDEWVSGPRLSLFPGEIASLNLPIMETPRLAMDPLDQWISPGKFGGFPADGEDDTEAIQKAIDSGAPTIYLPRGKEKRDPNDRGRHGAYLISDTIYIRGNVRRIIGLEASLKVTKDLAEHPEKPIFVFENGTSPVVIVERLRFTFDRFPNLAFLHRAERDLVLSAFSEGSCRHEGKGKLFIEDVVMGQMEISKGSVLYARQLNIEGGRMKLINDGGTAWILGLKTESRSPIALTKNGGVTEILGAHLYKCVKEGVEEIAFTVEDGAKMSLAGVAEYCWTPEFATNIFVKETRKGETRLLSKNNMPVHGNAGSAPLLSCFEPAQKNNPPPVVPPKIEIAKTTSASITMNFSNGQSGAYHEGGYLVKRGAKALRRVRGAFTDKGLIPNTDYEYEITAFDRFGQSSKPILVRVRTSADTEPPTTPAEIKIKRLEDKIVMLAWGASSDEVGVAGYKIERTDKSTGAAFTKTINSAKFTDQDVVKGGKYIYRVSAFDQAGNYSKSAEIEITVPLDPPKFIKQEAEDYKEKNGDVHKSWFIFNLHQGCWMLYPDIEIGRDAPFEEMTIRYGCNPDRRGSVIKVILDPVFKEEKGKKIFSGGEEVAKVVCESTGGWEQFKTFTIPIKAKNAGSHNVLLFIEKGESKEGNALVNIDWFAFHRAN